jgi:hypothetical protein
VRLPVLDVAEPAAEALRLMRAHRCSGILAPAGEHFRLYEAAQIVIALAESPQATLADVAPSALLGPFEGRSGQALVRPKPVPSARVLGSGLRRPITSLPISRVPDVELVRRLATAPRDCYCRIDFKPVEGGTSGADCPDGHRNSVRCV